MQERTLRVINLAAMSSGNIPFLVLKEGTGRTTGKDAQRNNIMAAKIVAETVKTTLGPSGMDKMLVSSIGDVTITNDGASILRELDVQHPVAKMLVEVAKTQDNEVGDGTTTSVILTGELLSKAEKLLDQNVHPTIVVEGFKKAGDRAQKILKKIAIPISTKGDPALLNIALTSMGSKGITGSREHFAQLAVQAVIQVAEDISNVLKVDIDLIKVIKKHGKGLEDTELIKGMVLDKKVASNQMPKRVDNARIALLSTKLEIEKTEFDAKISIERPEQIRLFLNEEERLLEEMADKVTKAGANVLICEKGIDDMVLHFLAKSNVLAVKGTSSSDMEKLAKATGAKIMASVNDLNSEALGAAKIVEEAKIGNDKLLYIRECKNPKAVTIVIRGSTEHIIEEAERSLHDAICVVRNAIEDGRIIVGGGSSEAEISRQLRKYAVTVGGREQLAIEAYAQAIETIPMILAENAGLDPIDIMAALRTEHEINEFPYFGIDMFSGKVTNMLDLNVVEPMRVKQQVIKSATEAANMILKIDDLISAKNAGKEPKIPKPPEA